MSFVVLKKSTLEVSVLSGKPLMTHKANALGDKRPKKRAF